jgi:TetR/AcrR family transcriptional regulator, ethionamide resistance regulator
MICLYDILPLMETSPPAGKPARRQLGRRAAPPEGAAPELREAILDATARLLAERSFTDLAVSEILASAGVSRGTFYFYFDSKQAVLAELVRRAVAQGHAAAGPWLGSPADPVAALRAGITAGAQLWKASAPVLRAIVENWHADPRLTALWLEQMQTFTDATIAQITADPRARQSLAGQDIPAVASALTWLGERLYYLAATNTPPFDNQDTLVSTLLSIWTSVLYQTRTDPGSAEPPSRGSGD